MICEGCGIAMRIQAGETRPEAGEGGGLRVYHVNRMVCVNPDCGKKGQAEERILLWEGPQPPVREGPQPPVHEGPQPPVRESGDGGPGSAG